MITDPPSRERIATLAQHVAPDLDEIAMAWQLLHEFRLVLRPAIVGEGWFCGRFKSVALSGQNICCQDETIAYAATAALAVEWAALKCIELDG